MLRKIAFPLLVVLALFSTVAAASYYGLVTSKVNTSVTGTGIADLAFAPADDAVGHAFVQTDPGQPLQVQLNFGNVQPNSIYNWSQVLKITNNEAFPVSVLIDGDYSHAITGDFKTMLSNYGVMFTATMSTGSYYYQVANGGQVFVMGTTTLAPGASTFVTFQLTTPYDFPGPGVFGGWIRFQGVST